MQHCCVAGCVLALTLTISPAMTQAETGAAAKADLPTQAETAQTLRQRYPENSIQSTETARQALAEVAKMRMDIDARYEEERHACFPKFFTNICLNKAKDRQREDLAAIRPIEIQANAFNRKQRVVERDRRLAEKAAKDEQERKERQIATPSHSATDAENTDLESGEPASSRTTRAEKSAQKRAAFAEAQRQREENAAAEAAKREENVRNYESKIETYKARQRDVAKKQAEKAQENHKKAP